MAIAVRRADLHADRVPLVDLLVGSLRPDFDGRSFDWLYRENPHGAARVWVAENSDTGTLVGAAAAFPRRLFMRGVEVSGCVLGDFCIRPSYRSLGPALQLQRACLAEVDSGLFTLGYDFPGQGMLAVYKRLGVELRERMVRLAKPLRADRKIAEKVRSRGVARGLSALSNVVLNLRDREFKPANNLAISLHEGHCGEEFSALARQASAALGVCVVRSATYLNWRFLKHPFRQYEILTARCGDALVGYVIFTHRGEDARVVELFGLTESEILRGLVAQLVALLRERGVITVSAAVLATHAHVALLASLGFHRRESCPVALFAGTERGAASGAPWFLMDGDRDS